MTTVYVYEEIFLKHTLSGHPEHAGRVSAIMEYLKKEALLPRLTGVPARPATLDELTRCHHPGYIERVEEVSRRGGGYLDSDTYVNA